MSRKGNSNDSRDFSDGRGKTGKPHGSGLKWVDGYLNDDDKQWLEAHRNEAPDYIFRLIRDSETGGSIQVKFDTYSGKYQAIYFAAPDDDNNGGCALSHRASSPVVAVFVLAYKHFVKYEGQWTDDKTSDSGGLWD